MFRYDEKAGISGMTREADEVDGKEERRWKVLNNFKELY